MDASFVGLMTVFVAFIPLRCLQLIIVFNPYVRKAYHKHFKLFKGALLLATVLLSITFYVILINGKTNGCLRR